MERLTERELYDGKVCFTKCSTINCPDKCAYCDIPKEANVRLKEYEDLEEQGKLLKLPCAVGNKVYYLTGTPNSLGKGKFDRVEESKAIGFYTDRDGLMVRLDYNWHGNHGTYGFLGKTVFLTREEAEEALKRMEGGE